MDRKTMMNKRSLIKSLFGGLVAVGFGTLLAVSAQAADVTAPDQLIRQLSLDILDTLKNDKAIQGGDVNKIIALVDTKVMPNVNFQHMTSSAVGRFWRQATPAQQQQLQDEFKTLMVRTYSGALSQVSNDQTIVVQPLRAGADDSDVVVRTQVRGSGDPIQLDYRLEKTPGQGFGWKIYNLNVMGVWLVETYRSQFAQEINAKGIDGLIATLTERNKANARKS